MSHTATGTLSRAFTLIEVVIAVIVLALAVPPTLNLMDSAAAGRVDAINTTRATMLASSVIETILADISSNNATLGFEALADDNAYLNTPSTGLTDRLSPVLSPYLDAGFSYSVVIGDLVSSDGSVSAESGENMFRVVTVNVSFISASSASYELPVSIMVSAL